MIDRDELTSMLGEGFHTAFRKAVDSQQAVQVHRLIDNMPVDDWHNVLEFVADGLVSWLESHDSQKSE